MNVKKLALELLVKVNLGEITLEELNSELAELKEQMSEIGDEGSDDFKAAALAAEELEGHIETVNGALKKTKEGFDDTTKAQKDAAKGSGIFAKGLKVVGGAFKALGIGLIVGAIKLFYDAISKNQRVMDALSTALGTIGILFEKAFNVIFDTVEAVYKASDGFSGLGKVMKGLITIGLTPVQLAFQSIKLVIQSAQLAWEKSFFGGGDEGKIKELTEDVNDTADAIKELGVDALNAGKDVVNNFSAAVGEISSVVGGAVEGIQKISVKGAIEQAKAQNELKNSAQVAAAQQALLVEKYDRQAEKLRQIRDEERNGLSERIKANQELGDVLDEQEKAMIAQANLQVAAAQANLNANNNIENQTALIEALANKQGVLAQVEGFRSEQKMNDLALDRERMQMNSQLSESESSLAMERKRFDAEQIDDKRKRLEKLREVNAEEFDIQVSRLEKNIELTNAETQARIDAEQEYNEYLEASRQRDIELEKEYLSATVEANKQANDEIEKDNEELQKKKQELAMAAFGALANIANLLSKGNEAQQKKAFQINKAISIGQAVQNTATGVTKALAQGGVAGIATGALVAASGIAQIAAISKTKFDGGSSVVTPSISDAPTLGGGNVGRVPRGLNTPTVNTDVQTTKVIVTETDIRDVSRNMDGVYSRATVVQ